MPGDSSFPGRDCLGLRKKDIDITKNACLPDFRLSGKHAFSVFFLIKMLDPGTGILCRVWQRNG